MVKNGSQVKGAVGISETHRVIAVDGGLPFHAVQTCTVVVILGVGIKRILGINLKTRKGRRCIGDRVVIAVKPLITVLALAAYWPQEVPKGDMLPRRPKVPLPLARLPIRPKARVPNAPDRFSWASRPKRRLSCVKLPVSEEKPFSRTKPIFSPLPRSSVPLRPNREPAVTPDFIWKVSTVSTPCISASACRKTKPVSITP